MQLVILGKGDRKYEEFFQWAANQYPGRMAVRLDYNEELSMAIYAGADLFLMPSKSEPCGLSQMIAMRYGTVPIVRETGGLKDTVQPYEAWRDAGNGFTFANYAGSDMLYVIRRPCTCTRITPMPSPGCAAAPWRAISAGPGARGTTCTSTAPSPASPGRR